MALGRETPRNQMKFPSQRGHLILLIEFRDDITASRLAKASGCFSEAYDKGCIMTAIVPTRSSPQINGASYYRFSRSFYHAIIPELPHPLTHEIRMPLDSSAFDACTASSVASG